MSYAPIVLFIYNRPEHTRQTLEALSKNLLAEQSDLIVYADGPKENASIAIIEKIKLTRTIVHEKKWCKTVTLIESEKNRGLAASIISGVTEVVNKYGKVIVLEDDIVTGKHFLEYMNTALKKYEPVKKVWHITGWRHPIKNVVDDASYFYPTMDCWSWGTWADRWQYFKKDAQLYKKIFTKQMIKHFNIEGSEPGMFSQIEMNLSGKINTWAIFWYATIFLKGGLCLAPTKSLVKNIGLDNSGTNCGENTAEEINHDLNLCIKKFPDKIAVTKSEYKKNISFFKTIHHQKVFKVYAKRVIKFFARPPYRALKWLYHHTLKRKNP